MRDVPPYGQLMRIKTKFYQSSCTKFKVTQPTLEDSLMLAAEKGHNEIVATLLLHKAAINIQDNEGKTALIWTMDMGTAVNIIIIS